jgi:hypothetical protein
MLQLTYYSCYVTTDLTVLFVMSLLHTVTAGE